MSALPGSQKAPVDIRSAWLSVREQSFKQQHLVHRPAGAGDRWTRVEVAAWVESIKRFQGCVCLCRSPDCNHITKAWSIYTVTHNCHLKGLFGMKGNSPAHVLGGQSLKQDTLVSLTIRSDRVKLLVSPTGAGKGGWCVATSSHSTEMEVMTWFNS